MAELLGYVLGNLRYQKWIYKGTHIDLPANPIHHSKSKEYYQNPDSFDTKPFSKENKAARNTYSFLPFGLGPRQCIST